MGVVPEGTHAWFVKKGQCRHTCAICGADEPSFQITSGGDPIEVHECEMKAAASVEGTFTYLKNDEATEVTGTFYSVKDLLQKKGIDVEGSHGFKAVASDGFVTGYTVAEVDDLYIFDMGEAISGGQPMGEAGQFRTAINGSAGNKWAADVVSMGVVPEGTHAWFVKNGQCRHKCAICNTDEPFADYDAVNAAIARAEALDSANYTAESYAAVTAAIDAVVTGKYECQQAEVDAMAAAINNAIDALICAQHTFGAPVWTWAADHSSATATFTCTAGDVSETLNAEVVRTVDGETITYTATVTFGGTEYTDVQTETMGVRVKSATVSLQDQLIIKFKLELKSGNAADYTVVYSIRGKETSTTLDKLSKESGLYVVKVPVVAKEMTEPVNIQVVDNNGSIVSNQVSYSVETYCLNKIKNTSNEQALRDICASILNYGAYAQITLDYNTEALANRSLPEYGYSTNVPNVTVPETSSSISGSTAGIKAKSATLGLEDVTIIRFKFELNDGESISDYKFTCDGKTYTPKKIVENGTTRYQISITGTAAKNLDNMYTVKVTKKGKGDYSVTYGALVYLYKKQNTTDQGLGNLCKAMYDYHLNAKEYFK